MNERVGIGGEGERLTVDELARLLIEQHRGEAIDVALEIVRQVSHQVQSNAFVNAESACDRANPVSYESVVLTVCNYFGVTEAELRSSARDRRTARARNYAWALLNERACLSLTQIGERFGRHHTTVMAGCERVDRYGQQWRKLGRRLSAQLEVRQ